MFVVKFQKNNLSYDRFGFVVAKTIDKRAVIRNALKRMVRGHIENTYLDLEKSVDVLFILRPAIKGMPREQVVREIDEVMLRVKSL
jgi:ribonuclease P protein component